MSDKILDVLQKNIEEVEKAKQTFITDSLLSRLTSVPKEKVIEEYEANIKGIKQAITELSALRSELSEAQDWQTAMENAGIDNWCGYDEGMRILREMQGDEDAE